MWKFPLEENSLWCKFIKRNMGFEENTYDSGDVSRLTFRSLGIEKDSNV